MLASISRFGRGWIGRRSRGRSPSVHQERKVVGRSRTVLPRELGLDVATGGQRLHGLDDEQVLDGDLGVLGEVVVLLGDEDSLTEEGLSLEYLVSLMFDSHSYPNAVADIHPAVVRRDRKAKVCLVQSRSRDVFFDVGLVSLRSLRSFGRACLLLLSPRFLNRMDWSIPRGSPCGRP